MYTKKYILRIIRDLKRHQYGITKNVQNFIINDSFIRSKYSEIIRNNSQSFIALPVNEMFVRAILPMLHSSQTIDCRLRKL